jgi:hypothetical protein
VTSRHIEIDDGWLLWCDAELRGAGFPIDIVLAASTDLDLGSFEVAWLAACERLHEVARAPRFREALIWQNRRAFHSGIRSLLAKPAAANARARRNDLMLASYVQRYGAKNETIGFFGASSPLTITNASSTVSLEGDAAKLRSRSIFVEPWAIDALADAFARDPGLRPDLIPRCSPTIRLEGRVLFHPVERRDVLPDEFMRVLAACDGRTTAREIAARHLATSGEAQTEHDVYDMLDELVAKHLVIWRLEIPTKGAAPEVLMREALGGLPDASRARVHATLARFEHARDVVAAAAGQPEKLDDALATLDESFHELTGLEGVRMEGRTYAGRTLVGEDCVRDVDVTLGAGFVERLRGPLALVLASARWFTYTIAQRYREALGVLYRRLVAQRDQRDLDYLRFDAEMRSLFPGGHVPGSIVAQVADEVRARWGEILQLSEPRIAERTVAGCRAGVARAFAAPMPGWPAARHHSPDLLLAASSVAAANRGDFQIVLGELHAGVNTLLGPTVAHRYEDPDALWALRDTEIAERTTAPVWSHNRTRLDAYSRAQHHVDVENGVARSWRPRDQVLAVGELVVVEHDHRLVVRTRDGRFSCDIVVFLEQHLIAESHGAFGLAPIGDHRPRVVMDGVVIAREAWSVSAEAVTFAHAPTPHERFTQARAWAQALGLPRFVFLRVVEETKPLFVDFDSAIFVENAVRIIKGTRRLVISEMRPDVDQLWLVDSEGRRYTSEIRITAVDPKVWQPA